MGAPSIIHLPDGQNFTVIPVFAGLFFKSHELSTHNNAFPIGWTVVLHTEDPVPREHGQPHLRDAHTRGEEAEKSHKGEKTKEKDNDDRHAQPQPRSTAYTQPTLQNDSLFISSISNPSSSEFKPAVSPTRQIAMMLWITLYWYFHQPAPSTILPATPSSSATPENGRPRGEWRINVERDGILRARNLIPKLERMGLIATLDSAVGTALDDPPQHMFVSRRAFWQIPARLFLFTLQPNQPGSPSPYHGSPVASRPGSPPPAAAQLPGLGGGGEVGSNDPQDAPPMASLTSAPSFPIGPFFSSSYLPTYYPPPPPQYTVTGHVRHPVRPKPPHMGEVFYCRFVPSAGAYLSFRVASLSPKPVTYLGPTTDGTTARLPGSRPVSRGSLPPDPRLTSPTRLQTAVQEHAHLQTLSDTALLQMWLAKPRVSRFWGGYVPDFLTKAVAARHTFPVIALWDGVPFGYLEIYWVKEDTVGMYLGGAGGSVAGDWDRGVHVLVGEEWARGLVPLWLSSVAHWIFTADYRTMSVCVEPRVDNERFIQHLQAGGFDKETEISLPHKQAWFGRLRRENWEGPSL